MTDTAPSEQPDDETILWNATPSAEWKQAFPVGSAAQGIIATRIDCTSPRSFTIGLDRQAADANPVASRDATHDADGSEIATWAGGNLIGLTGRFPEGIDFAAEARLVVAGDDATIAPAGDGSVEIAASRELGVDAELGNTWRETLAHLAPLQVGKHGHLQEYLVDQRWQDGALSEARITAGRAGDIALRLPDTGPWRVVPDSDAGTAWPADTADVTLQGAAGASWRIHRLDT